MAELFTTAFAAPYHYRRDGIYYLRMRVRGSTSESIAISLRTNSSVLAMEITKHILERLEGIHLREPSATWKQLRAHLHAITEGSLFAFHGDPLRTAYGIDTGAPPVARSFADSPFYREFFFTPRGIVEVGCAIQKPDYGNPDKGFSNPRGEYKVNITCSASEAQPLVDKITKAQEANYAALVKQFAKDEPTLKAGLTKGRKLLTPYVGELPFFENEDGTVTFKFKSYASYLDNKTQESKDIVLKVVDATGKRIDNVPAISGGSELKVRFSMFPYGWSHLAGSSVKLQIDSVMLITLVEANEDSEGWANESVKGGYEQA